MHTSIQPTRHRDNGRQPCWASLVPISIALLAFLLFNQRAFAQLQLSGVVNTPYANVLEVDTCNNQVLVGSRAGFAVGDRVMIIQAKGVDIERRDSDIFGGALAINDAGNFELATIAFIDSSLPHIRFANKLIKKYNANGGSGGVQLLRVPSAPDIVVNGVIAAQPWDGQTGGVIAIEATNTLQLDAPIVASGAGFMGGSASLLGNANSLERYIYSRASGDGGSKGESMTVLSTAEECGRGANLTGGGGGNAHNSGGAGGGNAGTGGLGGDQLDDLNNGGRLPIGGLGGRALDYISLKDRAVFGGGGGGGQANDFQGSDGAPGGGIILLRAKSIGGSNAVISADGASAASSDRDGAGGGGAGGTIILDVGSVSSLLNVSARGGNGGNASGHDATTCYAPGGGGGGGIIRVPQPLTGFTFAGSMVAGGAAGILSHVPGKACEGTSYGAQGGGFGTQQPPIVPGGTVVYSHPEVVGQKWTICSGNSTSLFGRNADSYLWTPAKGLDNPTIAQPKATPDTTTMYHLTMTGGSCTFLDSVLVTVVITPHPAISGPTALCVNSTGHYAVVDTAGRRYKWTVTGGTLKTVDNLDNIDVLWDQATNNGTVSLQILTPGDQCDAVESIAVLVGSSINPAIQGSNILCDGDSLTLSLAQAFQSYSWRLNGNLTGDTKPTLTIKQPGTYSVDVVTVDGCKGAAVPFVVALQTPPSVKVTSTTLVLDLGNTATLHATPKLASYHWSNGGTFDSIVVSAPGTYWVQGFDASGCSSFDTIVIAQGISTATATLGFGLPVHAKMGDHFDLPINIIQSKNLVLSKATDYAFDLRFNQSLLMPEDANIPRHNEGDMRVIHITGTRAMNDTLGTLTTIRMMAALGDTTETPITLENPTWTNGLAVTTSTVTGTFVLDGICTQSKNRLFSESGAVLLSYVRPNPAGNRAGVDYATIEKGQTRLVIMDMMGRVVLTPLDEESLEPGAYHADLDLSRIAPGSYMLLLETPTEVLRQPMIISR